MTPAIAIIGFGIFLLFSLTRGKKKTKARPDTGPIDVTPTTLPQVTIEIEAPPGFEGLATPTQWSTFTKQMKMAKLGTVTPGNHLGFFVLGYRALDDVGMVDNVRKETINGRSVWTGDFIPPLSRQRFLEEPSLQYQAFADYMTILKNVIFTRHKTAIGKTFEGKKATLSGLLGVAWMTGPAGLSRWLAGERKSSTTARYKATNGVF